MIIIGPATAVEPCVACGEETAVGSALYWDRHVEHLPDGTRVHRCEECAERLAVGPPDPPPEEGGNWLLPGLAGNDVRQDW